MSFLVHEASSSRNIKSSKIDLTVLVSDINVMVS